MSTANRSTLIRATTAQEPAKAGVAPLTLTLPLPPNMANGRMHWRVKNRKRQEYFTTCDFWRAVNTEWRGGIPAPPKNPLSGVTISALMIVGAMHDDDNALARLKWSLDWLVARGYLVDDSRKHVRWSGLPEQRVTRKEEPRVTFTITRTPEAA